MPGGDRTGPMGAGPMTGRAAGLCAGYAVPGYANPVPGGVGLGMRRGVGQGGGFGRGHAAEGGGGRGHRHWYYATGLPRWARFGGPTGAPAAAPGAEKQFLEQEAQSLQARLDEVSARLSDLEKETTAQ